MLYKISFCFCFIVLFSVGYQQSVTPYLILPIQTTQNVATEYSFHFHTDSDISDFASVEVAFPFEFNPRQLSQYTSCSVATPSSKVLEKRTCKLTRRSFMINVGSISIGNLTVAIAGIINPTDIEISSHFTVRTWFKDVKVTENIRFGRVPFTKAPIMASAQGTVYNYQNFLVEQGSTWVFKFTLDGSYPINSTVRLIFPFGFSSNKIQCNVTGITNSSTKTRVFPQLNIYDCLNVDSTLQGTQSIVISGIVNPNFAMQMEGVQVHILQPNSLVVKQIVDISNEPEIKPKTMNVSMTIPNKFRNNSITYITQINIDSDLGVGDYIEMKFDGNWTFNLQDCVLIEGVESSFFNKAQFGLEYNKPDYSKFFIRNFSSIHRSNQIAFQISLRTPLQADTYPLTITAFRSNGGVAQTYARNIEINDTTGYIKEMRLHPMRQAIKLPVGQTGPLQITLALRNNLPKTNVLTFGKFIIEISPHIPVPDPSVNGQVRCYFYGDVIAQSCDYVVDLAANPTTTTVTAFTPVDFNFHTSQIPFMVTTEGFASQDDEGLTIDTLVKRYHFRIKFYTDYSTVEPTEVIFSDWVADPIELGDNDFECQEIAIQQQQYDHVTCNLTTPNQVLNDDGHIHIFRIEFGLDGYDYELGYLADHIYPDYPCLVYGDVTADPYVKCDLITWRSGPYAAENGRAYINLYGFELIPPNSNITIELPNIQRKYQGYQQIQLFFSILEDTYGYQTDFIKLYGTVEQLQSTTYKNNFASYYTLQNQAYELTNPIINKVTDITLKNYDLGASDVDYIVFEVDQTVFQNIGRQRDISCGTHKCNKFGKPVQYFILFPQTSLNRYQDLTFPAITNPFHAGPFQFRVRVYKDFDYVKRDRFDIQIEPDALPTPVYQYSTSLETVTDIFPETDHFYEISWSLTNELPAQTSYIEVLFDNYFKLSSQYCLLVTSVGPSDGRQIECQVWENDNKVILSHMQLAAAGSTFKLTVQMTTDSTAASISPTVSIYTKIGSGHKIDQIENAAFTPASLTNTNRQTMSEFQVESPYVITGGVERGYLGDLLMNFVPKTNQVLSYLDITFTSEFYPYSNQDKLPLVCRVGPNRHSCYYSRNPFRVIITLNSGYSNSHTLINITTEYLQRNGIQHPVNPGRYKIRVQVSYGRYNTKETGEQYVDIQPSRIHYFKAEFAHRDAGKHNIFVFEFKNGQTTIPAYNDANNGSRIYIGFPTALSDESGAVFSQNLGFLKGNVIPCEFQAGAGFASAVSGKKLECRMRKSPFRPIPVYVEIINHDQIAPGQKIKVFMAKILNPASKQVDVNFVLKIFYFNPSNKEEHPFSLNRHNMFFDMLDASINSGLVEQNSASDMFQSGARVSGRNKYFKYMPYTQSGSFAPGDWIVIEMHQEFPLNGDSNVGNCLTTHYSYCLVFEQINWVAIQVSINSGSLIELRPVVSKLPGSISRIDTTFLCHTFLKQRWSQTFTYTITAANRWMQLRGAASDFSFEVLGSQNKLNIGQKNVDVLVSFKVSHQVNRQGTIQVQFPNDATLVPSIKPHCRSAITLGSALKGDPASKSSANNQQGEVGCLVQNSYSWLITSFDTLPAGSEVKIFGQIDLPAVLTTSLGSGYIVTYSDQHATDIFNNGRFIDYLEVNFPLQVQNPTWNLAIEPTLRDSQPLRVGHRGQFKFKVEVANTIGSIGSVTGAGYIDVDFWKKSVTLQAGGFGGPTSNIVCIIEVLTTGERLGCKVTDASTEASIDYYSYRIQSFEDLSPNTPYMVTLTSQDGSNDGIIFPSEAGTYKIETEICYQSSNGPVLSKAHYVEAYGPKFSTLNLMSTISTPQEQNLLLFEISTPISVSNNQHKLVIEIPTVSLDGVSMFDEDLGMGYQDYDDLIFDLYESSLTALTCKVYTGDRSNHQPVRIVCNKYSPSPIQSSYSFKMGFWVKNPATTIGLSVPIQVYFEQVKSHKKLVWQMIEAGVRVLPAVSTPITAKGNFKVSSTFRQINNIDFKFTNRNTKLMKAGDLYILRFNFDLKKNGLFSSTFKYKSSDYPFSGDTTFLRNCKTIFIKVGTKDLEIESPGQVFDTVKLQGVFFNPHIQLTTSQADIVGYVVYVSSSMAYEKILHTDRFPDLEPNEPNSPTLTMTAVRGNSHPKQREDYQISFKMSSSSLNDLSLVKKISIQLPTTTGLAFSSAECIEHGSSDIEIENCFIDTSTLTIWVKPVQKTSYINSDVLMIETVGLSVTNPTSSNPRLDTRLFEVKYYTWDSETAPQVLSTSDDFVFMKQDSTKLVSTPVTFTGPVQNLHQSVMLPDGNFVNQYLPSSSDINDNEDTGRTPFIFKLKASENFADKEGTSDYHQITVKYNQFYKTDGQDHEEDLLKNFPTCHLNGQRIFLCTKSSTQITMRFQQQITSGMEFVVRFSILDPTNAGRDGFRVKSLSVSKASLPIEISPFGGSQYYVEADPFPTYFQKLSDQAAYPSSSIHSVSLSWGNQVVGKINYLKFQLQLTRSDINGIVLEIPLLIVDGNKVYNDPKLMGLESGSEYPCSVGQGLDVFCFYEQGSTDGYGRPTRIHITKFSVQAGNKLSIRLLFTNPDIVGVFPSFRFKAYGDSNNPSQQLMGERFMGEYLLMDVFKTLPTTSNFDNSQNCLGKPQTGIGTEQTTYSFNIQSGHTAKSYIMLEWVLTDSTYGTMSQFRAKQLITDDYIVVTRSKSDRRVYIIRELASSFSSTGNYQFGYLRSKHHLANSYTIYLFQTSTLTIQVCPIDQTSIASDCYGPMNIQHLDFQDRTANTLGWQFMSITLGNNLPTDIPIDKDNTASEMILSVQFTVNPPFTSLSSTTTACSLESGLRSSDPLIPVECEMQDSNKRVIFRNFDEFTGKPLNFYYYATTPSGSFGDPRVQVKVFANSQAFDADKWQMFYSTTQDTYSPTKILLYKDDSYNSNTYPAVLTDISETIFNHDVDSGYVAIQQLSQTEIQLRVQKGATTQLTNVYEMNFLFFVQRLQFSANCRVLTKPLVTTTLSPTCKGNGNVIEINYEYFTSSSLPSWPDWNAGQDYTFKLEFDSISGQMPSANQSPEYLFVSMSYIWGSAQYTCGILGCLQSLIKKYGGQVILKQNSVPFSFQPQNFLQNGFSGDTISRQADVETELFLQMRQFKMAVGPSQNTFILFKFDDSPVWPNNNPFPETDHLKPAAEIDCKCISVSASETVITLTATSTYTHPMCVRYIPVDLSPSIGIFIEAKIGDTIRCYFPGFRNPSSSSSNSINMDVLVQTNGFFHRDIPRKYWAQYAEFDGVSIPLLTQSLQGSLTVQENSFFESQAKTGESRYYQLKLIPTLDTAYPNIYISAYAPQFSDELCNDQQKYTECRVYTSFLNRRFYLVAVSIIANVQTVDELRFQANVLFPPCLDSQAAYHDTIISWADSNQHIYFHTWTSTRTEIATILKPFEPTANLLPTLHGSSLEGYSSSLIFQVDLNGWTLRGISTTDSHYHNAFIKLTLTGFTSLVSCTAILRDMAMTASNVFFCEKQPSNQQLHIFAKNQVKFTGYLHVVLFTDSVPASTAYKIELFDRYQDATNYSRSLKAQGTFSRTIQNTFTLLQPTSVKWAPQNYKQYRTLQSPLRFTIDSTYIYKPDYDAASNSMLLTTDGIVVQHSGITWNPSMEYKCYVKRFKQGEEVFYDQYQLPCRKHTAAQKLIINPLPSQILSSNYLYEISIYKEQKGESALLPFSSSGLHDFVVETVSNSSVIDSDTLIFQDWKRSYVHPSVYDISLISIYTLTKEAGEQNSLFMNFIVNKAGCNYCFFEFEIDSLGLSSFGIQNGDQIPCHLDKNDFLTKVGYVQKPKCVGFANGVTGDFPLTVRVLGVKAWSSGESFQMALDNFINPSVQSLTATPINIKATLVDRTNDQRLESYWNQVVLIDNVNVGSSTQLTSGTMTIGSQQRGITTYNSIPITWPYTSDNNDISQKMTLKVEGGVTSCNSFDSLRLADGPNDYTNLWANTRANFSVWKTPSKSSGTSSFLRINGIQNPFAQHRDTYELLKTYRFAFYDKYKAQFTKSGSQFDFNTYTLSTQFKATSSLTKRDTTKSLPFHNGYPITMDITLDSSVNSFSGRQLDYTIVKFTAGVSSIEWAHARQEQSPYFFNSLLDVKIGKSNAAQPYIKISGMSDSSYLANKDWYIMVRFYASANTVQYTSTTYAMNQEIEFQNSESYTIPAASYVSSGTLPIAFEPIQRRYTKFFYELQNSKKFATAGSASEKLEFRFTTPYNIVNSEKIKLSPDADMTPSSNSQQIICIIQETIDSYTQTGVGKWAPCTFSSGTYTVTNPIGDLSQGKQYTLTIIEKDQTSSAFNMPIQPKRVEVTLVYTNSLNVEYGDVYTLDYEGQLSAFQVSHATIVPNWDNMVGVTFTPSFILDAASTSAPVTESVIELEIYSKNHANCLQADSMYLDDGMYFASGTQFSHYSEPRIQESSTLLKCGQYSESFAPIKLSTVDYGQVISGASYFFRYPLIRNPSANHAPFMYRLRLLKYESDAYYPKVVGSYSYENLQSVTNSGSSSPENGYLKIISGGNTQDNMALMFEWGSYNPSQGMETLVKFENDNIEALASLSPFVSLYSTTINNYKYQFYPHINLCVYIKTTTVNDRNMSLGTFPTSDDERNFGISWAYLYESQSERKYTGSKQLSIDQRTTWTSASLSKIEGMQSTYSDGIFKVSFRSSIQFPEGSYMLLTFQNSPFSVLDETCKEMSGFDQGSEYPNSNLACRQYSSSQLIIEGYKDIASNTALSFDLYLRTNTGSTSRYYPYVKIEVLSKDDKKILTANTNNLTYNVGSGSKTIQLQQNMYVDLTKGTAREMKFSFKLASNSLSVNLQYFQIDFGLWTMSAAAQGQIICKYQIQGDLFWVPVVLTHVSANTYKMGIYSNQSTYSIPQAKTVTVRIDHIDPDQYHGILVTDIQWNYLYITANAADGTILEHQYVEVWVEPYEHVSLNVDTALDYINAVNLYEFSVTPNVSISAGDYLLVEFRTDDELNDNLFSTTLGQNIDINDSKQISCRETDGATTTLSDQPLKCELFAGDISVTPSIPATVRIKVTKAVAADTDINFNLMSIKNPSVSSYPIGITLKAAETCYRGDQNRLCSYYKSTTYMQFSSSRPNAQEPNYSSIRFNPSLISATNTEYIIGAEVQIQAGDFVKVQFAALFSLPEKCTVTSDNGVCYSYPLENIIVIKSSVDQSPYSFKLSGMTNLYQESQDNLQTQIWKGSTGKIIYKFQTSYRFDMIKKDLSSNQDLKIEIFPTLAPDYQLSYGFKNIARFEISHLLQNKHIKQLRVFPPTNTILDKNYCNVTMESTPAQSKPYPYRFVCTYIGGQLWINMQDDFPIWQSADTNKKVIMYLKYTIGQSQVGKMAVWKVNIYTHPTSTYNRYFVGQAQGKIRVDKYQSPYIYKINFNTLSFNKRICRTNEDCMFYGYLLASTSIAKHKITYMDYVLAPEFGYSNLVNYDACVLEEKNDDYNPVTCVASRKDSEVTIRFTPQSYNHVYKLVSIDTTDLTKLFVAPEYPGDHYRMKVRLYTNQNLLIESQYVNITTVFGKLLNFNNIHITIPNDADTVGMYQISFKVGATDLLPSYPSSKTNAVTSAIELIFSDSFEDDLGTGKFTGDNLGCLAIEGLVFSGDSRIKCTLFPSVSTITQPTIVIQGYDRVLAGTVVTVRIAELKSLSAGVLDYIKVGVSLTYFDYGGVKGYVYEPTGVIVGPTTAPNPLKTITASVTETSTTVVGQLVNYDFTCELEAGFAPIKTTDFIGVRFPEHMFEGKFSTNSQAACSLAASSKCDSFGTASLVYFQPSSVQSSVTLGFSITSMINSAYTFQYSNVQIEIFTLVDGKLNAQGKAPMIKYSKPSQNISGLVTKIDSIYGGQSKLRYYIEFKLDSYLPEFGKISIIFPKVYNSLFNLNAKCNFSESSYRYTGASSFCEIIDDYQVIIAPNGVFFDPSRTYTMEISNITNPNINISSEIFIIKSFYDSDIYRNKIISQSSFSAPLINVREQKTCQFDLAIEARNSQISSLYEITIICPAVIEQASLMKLYLPWISATTTNSTCASSTDSLYSYQCNVKQEFSRIAKRSYLEIYLKEHVPQKYIKISTYIVNGIQGSYTLSAEVSYTGFTYLNAVSNSFWIQRIAIKSISSFEVEMQNYPYNRDYTAIYTFRIPNPRIAAKDLRIDMPASIIASSEELICRTESWKDSRTYFSLLVKGSTNKFTCQIQGSSLLIENVQSLLSQTSDFMFIVVHGLVNPDISKHNQLFKFIFLNLTQSSGLALAQAKDLLSYKISSTASNTQISTLELSAKKLKESSDYTFTIDSIDGNAIAINDNSSVGLSIEFPHEYMTIWPAISVPTDVSLTVGSSTYTSKKVEMGEGLLLAYFDISNMESFSSAAIKFSFRNPSTNIDCSVAGVFKIGVFDFKQNSFIAETISNNFECPFFKDQLFTVKVSGNSQIQAGDSAVFTVQLEKPAKDLKIVPSTSASSIEFEPSQIVFLSYGSRTKTFRIIASGSSFGSYNITFMKTEGGASQYEDIQNETITVISSISKYLIDFEEIDLKSIGQPIQLFINMAVSPKREFALVYTTNCSSDYAILPGSQIPIPEGATRAPYSITYKGSVIPEMCTINFEVSSLTSLNYELTVKTLYVSGFKSIDKTTSVPPMRLRVTKYPQPSVYVGHSILTKDKKSDLKPRIYTLFSNSVQANSVSMNATTSEPGYIYFAALQIGTREEQVTQRMIYDQNVSTGVKYGSTKAALSSGEVNIESTFAIDSLKSTSIYLIAAYVNSSVGISDIKFKKIETSKSSNGAAITLAFNSIQLNQTIIQALSDVLRIEPQRIAVLTFKDTLQSMRDSYTSAVMNKRRFVYEVAVGPNLLDSSISPIDTVNQLSGSETLKTKLSDIIGSLDMTYSMNTREISLDKPRVRSPVMNITQLTSSTIVTRVKFWQQAKVYGVIVPYEQGAEQLLSKQIIEGTGRNNQPLKKGHAAQIQTNPEGQAQLTFNLLQSETVYELFITAECMLPFQPRLRLPDESVLRKVLTTGVNLNVVDSEQKILQKLKEDNNIELAEAVRKHIASVEQKKAIQPKARRVRVIK